MQLAYDCIKKREADSLAIAILSFGFLFLSLVHGANTFDVGRGFSDRANTFCRILLEAYVMRFIQNSASVFGCNVNAAIP